MSPYTSLYHIAESRLLMVRSLVYSCLWLTLLLIACTPTIAPSAPASNAVQPSLYRQGQSAVSGLYVQAQQRIQQRDYVGAEQLYQQAVAQEPGNPLAYVGIGACRVLTNDLDTAEQMYHKALELDPHLAMAYVGLGSVAAKREQFRDSMRWHARACRGSGRH